MYAKSFSQPRKIITFSNSLSSASFINYTAQEAAFTACLVNFSTRIMNSADKNFAESAGV